MSDKNIKDNIFVYRKIYPDVSKFWEIEHKSPEDLKDNCIYVLDTNCLLVPYQNNPKDFSPVWDIYKKLVNHKENGKIAPKLFIIDHVLREFIHNKHNFLRDIIQKLNDHKSTLSLKDYPKIPILDNVSEYSEISDINDGIQKKIHEIRNKIKNTITEIKKWGWNDPIFKKYKKIFEEKGIFSTEFVYESKDGENQFRTELKLRNKFQIPPGFKDSNKYESGNVEGDLLLWYGILKIGKEFEKNIILISNDKKKDWVIQINNEILYPRYELCYEFYTETNGNSFNIVDFNNFLKLESFEGKALSVDVNEIQTSNIYSKYPNTNKMRNLIENWVKSNFNINQFSIKISEGLFDSIVETGEYLFKFQFNFRYLNINKLIWVINSDIYQRELIKGKSIYVVILRKSEPIARYDEKSLLNLHFPIILVYLDMHKICTVMINLEAEKLFPDLKLDKNILYHLL